MRLGAPLILFSSTYWRLPLGRHDEISQITSGLHRPYSDNYQYLCALRMGVCAWYGSDTEKNSASLTPTVPPRYCKNRLDSFTRFSYVLNINLHLSAKTSNYSVTAGKAMIIRLPQSLTRHSGIIFPER